MRISNQNNNYQIRNRTVIKKVLLLFQSAALDCFIQPAMLSLAILNDPTDALSFLPID